MSNKKLSAKAEAVLMATVIVGVAERVLNVPDGVKSRYRKRPAEFTERVAPRLSSGDQPLWDDFDRAISPNRPDHSAKTVTKFRQLRTRPAGHTHVVGYDYILLVPAYIDNVNPPYIPEPSDPQSLGIDVQRAYDAMLERICKAYSTRSHL